MAYLEYKPNSPLFHYTTQAGFIGITTSKTLWLSDVRSSNDPRELSLGIDLIRSAINSDDISPHARNLIIELIDSVDFYRSGATLYNCSFGLNGDEIPMWREYADSYKGISIGFRPTAIEAILARMQLVRYAEDDISGYLKSIMLELSQKMGKPRSILRALTCSEVLCLLTTLKHRSWKYEKEARLTFSQRDAAPDPMDALTRYVGEHSDGTVVEWREPMIRTSNDRDVKYLPFAFGRRRNQAVDYKRSISIVLTGPKCEMSNAEVERHLVEQGFEDFRVQRSECEVR